jgi:hypothetical protein
VIRPGINPNAAHPRGFIFARSEPDRTLAGTLAISTQCLRKEAEYFAPLTASVARLEPMQAASHA